MCASTLFPRSLLPACLALFLLAARRWLGWWLSRTVAEHRGRRDLPDELPAQLYRPAGGGDGELLVFIHGWPDGPDVWRKVVSHVRDACPAKTLLVVSLPGYGDVDDGATGGARAMLSMDFPVVVEMLRRTVIKHRSANRPVTVVAHDWGCSYAYRLQAACPQLIGRMVCLDVGAHAAWTLREWRGVLRYQLPLTLAFVASLVRSSFGMPGRRLGSGRSSRTEALAKGLGAPDWRGKPDRISYSYFFFHLRLVAGLLLGLPDAAAFPEVMCDDDDGDDQRGGSGPIAAATPEHFRRCPLLYVFGTKKGNPPIHFHSNQWLSRVDLCQQQEQHQQHQQHQNQHQQRRTLALDVGHWIQVSDRVDELNEAIVDFLRTTSLERKAIKADKGNGQPSPSPVFPPSPASSPAARCRRFAKLVWPPLEVAALSCCVAQIWSWIMMVMKVIDTTTSYTTTAAAATITVVATAVVAAKYLYSLCSSAVDKEIPRVPGRHSLGSRAHKAKKDWAEQFGPVFVYTQEGRDQVVLSDPASVALVCGAPGSSKRRRTSMSRDFDEKTRTAAETAGPVSERMSRFQESLEATLTLGVPSIFTLKEGPEWQRRRKAAARFFSASNLALFQEQISARVRAVDAILLDHHRHHHHDGQNQQHQALDLDDLMIRLALDVIGDVGLAVDIGALAAGSLKQCRIQQLVVTLINETVSSMYSNTSSSSCCRGPRRRRTSSPSDAGRELWQYADEVLSRYLRDSSQKKRERGDKAPRAKGIPLIGFLLDGHVGGGGVGGGGGGGGVAAADEGVAVAVAAKDRAIADIITFLVAGHETTGHTLGWTLWLLATHPRCEARLLEALREHRAALQENKQGEEGKGNKAVDADGKLAPPCAYLDAVIFESMRLKPVSAAGTGRIMSKTVRLPEPTSSAQGGCPHGATLRAGQAVNCAFYSLHTSRETWGNDAMAFKPERWLSSAEAAAAAAVSTPAQRAQQEEAACRFLPFSIGPRSCAGRRLALLEVRTALEMLVPRWSFRPTVDAASVGEYCAINMTARGGLMVEAVKRDSR